MKCIRIEDRKRKGVDQVVGKKKNKEWEVRGE